MNDHDKIMGYISQHPMAVLGTVNEDGTPQGAIVYICELGTKKIGFVTKNQTQKYQNLVDRPSVSLTIGDDANASTLQISGKAHVINNAQEIEEAMHKITKIHARGAEWLPPIAKIHAGSYTVIGITITSARLAEFGGRDIGSQQIFTQI